MYPYFESIQQRMPCVKSPAAAAAAAAEDDEEPSTDNKIDLEYMIVNIPSFSLIPLWN